MKLSSKISVDKDISRAQLIDPEFYTSDNYFQATKNIFLKSWQFVNHINCFKFLKLSIIKFYGKS